MRGLVVAREERGLTLIELIISLALGLVLLLALATLFVQSGRSARQNEAIISLQDQARFAISTLSRDLAMAGYWGGVYLGSEIEPGASASGGLAASKDCGPSGESWAFETTRRVEFYNADAGQDVNSQFHCLENLVDGTDVLALRRAAGQEAATASNCAEITLAANTFYLKTNGVSGSIVRTASSGAISPCITDAPFAAPVTFYKYVPRIYYVRDYAKTEGDGTPTLCRRELQHAASASLAEECLAEGVEDLQVVWGIDEDGDANRAADLYTSTPTAEQLLRAVTAQIFLRIRGSRGDTTYIDEKTYSYADKTADNESLNGGAFTPTDYEDPPGTEEDEKLRHFYRRVFSTTVQIRNPLPPL